MSGSDPELRPRPSPGITEAGRMARSWSIAMNFAFGVIGMAGLGWAVQTYVWPASKPWMLLSCLGVGLVGGFVQFVRDGLRQANAPDPGERASGPSRPAK